LGHAPAGIPWAEHAAAVAAENNVLTSAGFWVKADWTSARTACSALDDVDTLSAVRDASTSTSTLIGDSA
jgi:hypothetical protein